MSKSSNRRKDILWNSFGGGIVAFQSAILLFFAARLYGHDTAGVISIAYALAVFIYTIGRYGMRAYQSTDVTHRYSFGEYLKSRYISLFIAIVILLAYLVFSLFLNGYSIEKATIIFEIVFLRLINAFEDVFCGHLQKMDRFLEGAKIMALREGLTLCVILVLMILKQKLIIVFFAGILTSIAIECFLLVRIKHSFTVDGCDIMNAFSLLKECFPLAFGTAFAVYLSNIPKYVTDWYLDDSMQAIVGYLILPVFTIALLNQFIYNPFIRDLGSLYHSGARKMFYKRVFKQTAIILLSTALIGLGTLFIGLPVLAYVYNADLNAYRVEFIILLFGGCLYAIQYYLTIPITVIKQQKKMLYGYIGVIIITTLLQKRMVNAMKLRGAALVYVISNMVMALYLLLLLFFDNRDFCKSVHLEGSCLQPR